ncbi:hypothetical protein GKZ68_20670 (plasmid) [Hymenobacter sp. BRD128]|uniref:hypothetical protein n=1 Tax=Hymenobacter sp. BRD128 TaxID=2675878 RepID=UPI00156592AC|nr:hypothetical protein [Hymenobacter sp. BRD128]QKG59098.1 hypothetical protein GKZ68_20670 [Hymenobacter sp. BRD128]
MDFSAPLPPPAILAYLLSQAPALAGADHLACQQARDYLLAIGTYYHQPPAGALAYGGEARPACSVAPVLATAQHPDALAVLRMLQTDPVSAKLTAGFQLAARQSAFQQAAGVLAYAQLLLSVLDPGRLAAERVTAYLSPFAR